jgi:hypothetical protein
MSKRFDPRWTYTAHGELPPKKVEVRQVKLPNTIFLDTSSELVLDIECVKEVAPKEWPRRKRFSTIMVGIGQQVGKNFYITQYGSDWEKDLMDAIRPALGLAKLVYIEARGDFDSLVLAGHWVSAQADTWGDYPLWPAVNILKKTRNVRSLLREQRIESQVDRTGDISGKDVPRLWTIPRGQRAPLISAREKVWRHNYLDVLDTSKKIFQIEW